MNEIVIRGVPVSFARRDIRQCTDAERADIEALVVAEKREVGEDAAIERIVIDSDWIDTDRWRANVHYRVHTRAYREEESDGGEPADRSDAA